MDATTRNGVKKAARKAETGGATARKKTKSAGKSRTKPPLARQSKKTDAILALLRRKNGASVDEMAKATDWQIHSVRGFLSGTVKKKLGLAIASDKPDDGTRRYFLKSV